MNITFRTGPEVRSYRQTVGLNQLTFWGAIGITQSGGSRYESGRKIPAPIQLLLNLTYGSPEHAQELLLLLRAAPEKPAACQSCGKKQTAPLLKFDFSAAVNSMPTIPA